MTPPRSPREFRDQLDRISVLLDHIRKEYEEAYVVSHEPPSGSGRGSGPADPTAQAYSAGGHRRYLLRRVNGKVSTIARLAEDAAVDLDHIYERGYPAAR